MRLTILINGPDPTDNHDYALLWLDTEERRWSREAHSGIELPEWGEIENRGTETVLVGSASPAPLCVLHGLQVSRHQEVSGAGGLATLAHEVDPARTDWHWRLQAVDRAQVRAESAVFAGEGLTRPSTFPAHPTYRPHPTPAANVRHTR
ncbi:DUF3564 family protein [Paraburkholderia mimosarum]|uniref:DUF3564 family protein n=1 Tax=Paraburkholderia mimosarum TaxID=312026 RepID=UPI0007C44AD8|nr:DUF3564 family protein [Paraburkholderia mimosarum]